MFRDSDGKFCAAKTAFISCLSTFLIVILHHEFNGMSTSLDYQGMAVFLGVSGTVYFGRSHTKSGQE